MNWLEELQKSFAYELKHGGYELLTECTIWNENGLSVRAEAYSAEEAIELALYRANNGTWK